MINEYGGMILGVLMLVGMIFIPRECLDSALSGLDMCFKIIIPSLFPFFICSKLLIKSGFAQMLGKMFKSIMRPLFNVPGCGAFAFVIGLLSGYPVGAKCAAELYEQKACTKAEAERLICFCNNSGPLFILGSVAVGMLLSETAGVLMYIAHVLSAITIGIIFRFYKSSETIPSLKEYTPKIDKQSIGKILSSSISESIELILYVCGFVVFFSVFLNILEISGILELFKSIFTAFGVPNDISTAISYGFFEMVNGVKKLSLLPIGNIKLVLISIIISWGGVSVLLQVFGIISKYGFSKKLFVTAKALQGIFAGLYMLILLHLPVGEVAVFAQNSSRYTLPSAWAYSVLLLIIAIIFYFILSTAYFIVKTVTKL